MKRNKFIQEFNLTFAYSDDDYESCFPRLDQWLHVAAKVMWEKWILGWLFIHGGMSNLDLNLAAYLGLSKISRI